MVRSASQGASGDFAPPEHPYTVADALADYRADYLRRGGKAADRLDWSAAAWIHPELGAIELARLGKARIVAWHQKIAETPARLRTKPGEEQKHREADDSPEAVRRRRSTANRMLTIRKAALNHAHPEGECASDDAWRTVRAFREADAARLRGQIGATAPAQRGLHARPDRSGRQFSRAARSLCQPPCVVEKHYGHRSPGYIADTVRQAFGSLGIVPPSNAAPIAAAR